MSSYQPPYATNELFNTNDYLLNDTKLTKREGNIMFVQKILEGTDWPDFLNYIKDTYGLEFSVIQDIGANPTIRMLEDTDLLINLPDSTGSGRYVRFSQGCIIRLDNTEATTSIGNDLSTTQFFGDLVGESATSTSSNTAINYIPVSGIDTSITSLTSSVVQLPYGFAINGTTNKVSFGYLNSRTLNITNVCTLTKNETRTIAGNSPIVTNFGGNLNEIDMDNDFEVYIYDSNSQHPLTAYNYLSFSQNDGGAINYAYVLFGQFDDIVSANSSNDFPFLRVLTNAQNANFAGIGLSGRGQNASSDRGSWVDTSRFQVLRLQYNNPTEKFIWSVTPNTGTSVIQIHTSNIISEVICEKNFTATVSKTFDIIHPVDKTQHLRHACIESSEVKNIYRDTVDVVGKRIIDIDDYFGMMNGTFFALNKDISVSVTNNKTFDNSIGYIEDKKLVIEVETDEPTSISFIIWGTRNDKNIINNKNTDINGDLITEFLRPRDNE